MLAPIRFTNIRRNELASKIPLRNVQRAMQDLSSPVESFIEEDRQQRAAMVLEDVDYVIEATFEITDRAGTSRNGRHVIPRIANRANTYEIFVRRAETGQCFSQPYFGTREFPASFAWIEKTDIPPSPLSGQQGPWAGCSMISTSQMAWSRASSTRRCEMEWWKYLPSKAKEVKA